MDYFFGRSTSAPPPPRNLVTILISWLSRAFILFAVSVVIAVICWQLFKHYLYKMRRVNAAIRPEYMDLVTRMREWFYLQHTRPEPPPRTQEQNNFHSAETGCPICLLDPAEIPIQTNCGHLYCGNCITAYWHQGTWEASGVKCPVCRQRVTLLMRDMRPGTVMPADPDRALEIEQEIRRYNQRFSGEPRSLIEKIRDLPSILQHLWRNFTLVNGLGLLFHGRVIMYVVMFLVYFVLPFDLLPESFLGIFGLVDDLAVLGVVFTQLAAMWRAVIVRDGAE